MNVFLVSGLTLKIGEKIVNKQCEPVEVLVMENEKVNTGTNKCIK